MTPNSTDDLLSAIEKMSEEEIDRVLTQHYVLPQPRTIL